MNLQTLNSCQALDRQKGFISKNFLSLSESCFQFVSSTPGGFFVFAPALVRYPILCWFHALLAVCLLVAFALRVVSE